MREILQRFPLLGTDRLQTGREVGGGEDVIGQHLAKRGKQVVFVSAFLVHIKRATGK